MAEVAFYSEIPISEPLDQLSPNAFLADLRNCGRESVFLQVDIDIDGIIDFTDGRTIQHFLHAGFARHTYRPPEYWVQYLCLLVSPSKGGNVNTDVLGHEAYKLGHSGAVFPSVRALLYEASVPATVPLGIRLGLHHAQPGGLGSNANIMDLHWLLEQQLRREHNLAIFSGSITTRSIKSFRWLDADGRNGGGENPYYMAAAEALEATRLKERVRLTLDERAAIAAGLLADHEIDTEFYPAAMWIRCEP